MITELCIRALGVVLGFGAGFWLRSWLGPEPLDPRAWRNWRVRK